MSPADRDFAAAEAWVRRCMAEGSASLNLAEGEFPALEAIPSIVAEWQGLAHVLAEYTRIADLDVLAGLPEIGLVEVWGTPIRSIEPLRSKPIEVLDISDTRVTDLSPLEGMTGMTNLCLSGLPVEDRHLPMIARMTRLKELDLNGTQITDLTPLSGLTELQSLSLGHCSVTDLSPLTTLTNLCKLELHETPVTDLTPLLALPKLAEDPLHDGLVLTGCAAVAGTGIAKISAPSLRAATLFVHLMHQAPNSAFNPWRDGHI